MSEALGLLTGIVRPIPGVSTFVVPVFRQPGGRVVIQRADDAGRVTSFDPINLGEGFERLSENHVVYENDPALYGFELEPGRIAFGSAPGLASLLLKTESESFTTTERESRAATYAAVGRFLGFAESLKCKHSHYSFVCSDRDRAQSFDLLLQRGRLTEENKFKFWMSFVEVCKADLVRCTRATDPVPRELGKYRLGNAIRALGEYACNDKSLYQLRSALKSYEAAFEVYSLIESSADILSNLRALGHVLKALESDRRADQRSRVEPRPIMFIGPVDVSSFADVHSSVLASSKRYRVSSRSIERGDSYAPPFLKYSGQEGGVARALAPKIPVIVLKPRTIVSGENDRGLVRQGSLVRTYHSILSQVPTFVGPQGAGVLIDRCIVLTAHHVALSAKFKEVGPRSGTHVETDLKILHLGLSTSDDPVGCDVGQGSGLFTRCLMEILKGGVGDFAAESSLRAASASSIAALRPHANHDDFTFLHLCTHGIFESTPDPLRSLRPWVTNDSVAARVEWGNALVRAVKELADIDHCLNEKSIACTDFRKSDYEGRDSVFEPILRVASRFQKEQVEFKNVIDPIWEVAEQDNFRSVIGAVDAFIIRPFSVDGEEYYHSAFEIDRRAGSECDEKAERGLALVYRCTSSKLIRDSIIALAGLCTPSAGEDATSSSLKRDSRESDRKG